MKTYRIGTRGSLLALTQTQQVKSQLEKLTGDAFEIITIKTQGDLQQSKPLWQMEGKDFFTKELDEALLLNKIDLVVHSYKDLGSIRPEGIFLGAITQRTYAHDIFLIKKSTIPQIAHRDEFVIGTSSPRRMVNMEKNFQAYLPGRKNHLKITTKALRGNINTRIQKLVDGEYDGIVLAFAGLERLSQDPTAKVILQDLVKELDFMILPVSSFPPASSQGALAIECLESNTELKNKLKLMEDPHTIAEVKREREAFKVYGGGCHLAVGIHVKKIHDHFIHYHRGQVDQHPIFYQYLERKNPLPHLKMKKMKKVFIGLPIAKAKLEKEEVKENFILWDEIIKKEILPASFSPHSHQAHYFITSSYVIPTFQQMMNKINKRGMIWAAGQATMNKLVEKGFWVHGQADSIGYQEIQHFLRSHFISLFIPNEVKVITLTNDESQSILGETIPCYTRVMEPLTDSFKEEFFQVQIFYWTSFFQYQTYTKLFPHLNRQQKDLYHCCGLGKTFEEFQKNDISVIPFINIESFKDWIRP